VLLLMEALTMILFPACAGLAVVAPDMINVVLGAQWVNAVPIIQALAALAALRAISPLIGQILISRNKTGSAVKYSLIALVVLPVSFFLASSRGPVAVALVWVTIFPALLMQQFAAAAREIELPLWQGVRAILPSVIGTGLMCLAVVGVRMLVAPLNTGAVLRLALCIGTGAVVYGVWLAVSSRDRVRTVIRLIRQRTL
jgi:O-antigen/teichoic acid export membrane protein